MKQWRDFCERLAALGERVDTPEGVHHLANQVACWLTWSLGHTDPERPAFFRSSDLVYQWGGPNADQVARRALIDGRGTYRISGRMGSCEEFALQVKAGTSQSGGAGVATEVSASDLGVGPGDDIDIVLGAGGDIPLDTDAAFVHVRDYYFDWRPLEPATFVIERLDTHGPRPARTAESVAALLGDAAAEIEHSMDFWHGYQERMLDGTPPNAFTSPGSAARGVVGMAYSHGFVELAPDQALVVDLRAGDAPLWDVQLYNCPWYEALDWANRTTSTNHRLCHPDDDGRVRVVVAAADTGAPDWLDTEGRDRVLCTVRWWRPPSEPFVDVHLVPLTDVAGPVTPHERAAEVRRRAAHAAWRYRT